MGCVACAPVEGTATLGPAFSSRSALTMPGPIINGPPMPQLFPEPFVTHVYNNILSDPDKIFLIDAGDGGREWRYGDLLQRARCWAQWLHSHGLGKGAVVSIAAENSMDTFSVLLGTWLSGAAANPFNFNFDANDIKVMFEVSVPDVVYCTKNLDTIEKAVAAWGRSIPIVTSGTSNGSHTGFSDILKMDVSDFELETFDSPNHILSIMFTSGTTGIPKGVLIPDNNLKKYSVSGFLDYEPLMITSPPFWISNTMGFSFTLRGQQRMVIPKQNAKTIDILETIQTFKPESWFTGHSVALDLTQCPYTPNYDLSSLKYFVTGGTLLLAPQRRVINKVVFNDKLKLKHLYGSTEVGIITRWADFIDLDTDEYNSVGCPATGVSLKILGPNEELLGPLEHGEVVVKTESLTPGLFVKGRERKYPLDDEGWFRTGDKGYYDEKGLIYIVGRIKDIMKFKGVQISPAEIEEVVDKHPAVFESCAVGKPDVKDGDIPVIFIVLRKDVDISENELYQYVEDNIAEVKRPREIHIIEALPKSAVGKVLRGDLQKMLENE